MGVYIKGIKTPAIVKVHYLNGRRYIEDPQSGEWREMVDIPPHGRLIDADALMENCMKEDTFLAEMLFRKLSNAPTIIPPSEEGE